MSLEQIKEQLEIKPTPKTRKNISVTLNHQRSKLFLLQQNSN